MHSENGRSFTDLVLLIFKLNGKLLSTGDELTKNLGLTSSKWQVMGAIVEVELTVADIARNMGLTRQSVQRTVDILIDDEICRFDENPRHKRARLVCLTPLGRRKYNKISQIQMRWANDLAAMIPKKNLDVSVKVLKQTYDLLKG